MNDIVKNKYIELIQKINLEDNVTHSLKAFISSYDGTNEVDLNRFMLSMIRFMMQSCTFKIKADAYDKLLEAKEINDDKLEVLSNELENLMHPAALPLPSVKELKNHGYIKSD